MKFQPVSKKDCEEAKLHRLGAVSSAVLSAEVSTKEEALAKVGVFLAILCR